MFYKSTRNSEVKVSSAQAIAQGISEDGGLFVPSEIPAITLDDIKALGEKSYAEPEYALEAVSPQRISAVRIFWTDR